MKSDRYSRHYSVIGIKGQQCISNGSVLVVGCGGIGCPAALYLVAAGVGKIGIVDDDVVALSNLQRQVLFTESDLGQLKTDVAYRRLKALNNDTEIKLYNTRMSFENAEDIIKSYSLIIDGSDNYQTRYLVNDVCSYLDIPFISASVLKKDAQIIYFDIKNGCYRCLYPEPAPKEFSPSCDQAGVLGSVTGVAGTLAATLALNFLLEEYVDTNTIKWFNSSTLSLKERGFTKAVNCPACVKKKIEPIKANRVFGYDYNLSLTFAKAKRDYQIIDVREDWELQITPLSNSTHIPLEKLLSNPLTLDKQTKLLLVCKTGIRSTIATQLLRERGYENSFSLLGGITAWLSD